jgi:hypothetical protein
MESDCSEFSPTHEPRNIRARDRECPDSKGINEMTKVDLADCRKALNVSKVTIV